MPNETRSQVSQVFRLFDFSSRFSIALVPPILVPQPNRGNLAASHPVKLDDPIPMPAGPMKNDFMSGGLQNELRPLRTPFKYPERADVAARQFSFRKHKQIAFAL